MIDAETTDELTLIAQLHRLFAAPMSLPLIDLDDLSERIREMHERLVALPVTDYAKPHLERGARLLSTFITALDAARHDVSQTAKDI